MDQPGDLYAMNSIDLREAIKYIPVASLSYQEWINVGMALKLEGYDCEVWEDWSTNDTRYHHGECAKKWATFNGSDNNVTGGTIIDMAKRYGFQTASDRWSIVFDWNDEIGRDKSPAIDSGWVEKEAVRVPTKINTSEQAEEMISYLNALFEPDDLVSYVMESYRDDDGKYKPSASGHTRKASDLIALLKKHKNIDSVFGTYNHQAGAWIRFNPMDGKGNKNENVADYRYALVEADSGEIETQAALLKAMQLPIAAMLFSGKKSIHAIVRIQAATLTEYKARVDKLYDYCAKNGLKVDTQNKNPSRLSRMVGVERDGKWQHLLGTNIGQPSWQAWVEYIADMEDDFPDIVNWSDVWDKEIRLSPCLIGTEENGLLRRGHKMLISGASKSGKSFLEIELAIAISEGRQFLRWPCQMGKVLYINLEIDGNSFYKRVQEVYKAMGITHPHHENLSIWNLRGKEAWISKLAKSLVHRGKDSGYSAVIIDPLYKIFNGDENSAGDVATMFRFFDVITEELHTALIFAHHHSKGVQSGKASMDRASGSGVFARDPDAVLDAVEIEPADVNYEMGTASSALRISCTLREFEEPKPFEVIFDFPVHKIASGLEEAGLKHSADPKTNSKRGNKAKQVKADERRDNYLTAYENIEMVNDGDPVTVSDIASYFNKSDKTVRRDLKMMEDTFIVKFSEVTLARDKKRDKPL